MLYIKLNYLAHLLFNSKYKFLLNILFFSSFMFIYNLYINEIDLVECMKRSKPNTIEMPESNIEHIQLLENENKQLKEHMHRLEDQIISSTSDTTVSYATYEATISSLETNQHYLINKVNALQQKLTEAKGLISELAGDNVELRTNAIERQQAFDKTLEDLEIAKRHCTDTLNALHKLTGPR